MAKLMSNMKLDKEPDTKTGEIHFDPSLLDIDGGMLREFEKVM